MRWTHHLSTPNLPHFAQGAILEPSARSAEIGLASRLGARFWGFGAIVLHLPSGPPTWNQLRGTILKENILLDPPVRFHVKQEARLCCWRANTPTKFHAWHTSWRARKQRSRPFRFTRGPNLPTKAIGGLLNNEMAFVLRPAPFERKNHGQPLASNCESGPWESLKQASFSPSCQPIFEGGNRIQKSGPFHLEQPSIGAKSSSFAQAGQSQSASPSDPGTWPNRPLL